MGLGDRFRRLYGPDDERDQKTRDRIGSAAVARTAAINTIRRIDKQRLLLDSDARRADGALRR